jgi:hypothetical protein
MRWPSDCHERERERMSERESESERESSIGGDNTESVQREDKQKEETLKPTCTEDKIKVMKDRKN